MPIVTYTQDSIGQTVRNRWICPPNCVSYPDDIVTRREYFRHWAEYVPEHRPYPSDLLASMTAREKVYRRGGSAPSIYEYSETPCPHSGVHGVIKGFHYITGDSTLYQSPLYDPTALEAEQIWASKLREKIDADKVSLGSSLAEYRETVKMFVKTAHGIHDAWKVLRGRKVRSKLKVCSVPAAVLQYNFGVAPLVEDLYSSAEMLRLRMDRPIYRRISAGIKVKREGSFPYGLYQYHATGTFSERATVHFRVNPSLYLSSDFDFGNPIEWAWELIPFSFVVDWAIPIGEWLGQLDALQGISHIHGTVTTRTEDRFRYTGIAPAITERDGTYHQTTYKRKVLDTIPMPAIPKWSPSLSGKRAINALSLLVGLSSQCRKG